MQNKKKFNPGRFIGMVLTAMLTIPAFSGSAQASGASLVDILQAKGVLTEGEAKAAKVDSKKHHKHLKFGGRLMADYAFYADDPGLDMGTGQEIRRARLFAKGSFEDWHFKTQFDFAGNKTTAKDLYIKYTGFKPVTISVGQFFEENTMEEPTSSKYITFMERGLPTIFAGGRAIGIGIDSHGDFWTAAIGAFGGTASGTTQGIDSRFDLTGRIAIAPFHEKGRVLHLGGSVAYRLPDSDRTLRIRQRPESHVTHFRLVDTGSIANVDNYITSGLEAAAVYGPFSVQGEYLRTDVSLQDGLTNEPSFDGFYAYASWFLTGESRPYSVKHGRFGRVHPIHNLGANGWGALELAVRFSQLELDSKGVAGGEEQNVTVGVNWYPHPHVRFMLNYIRVSVDRSPVNTLVATSNFSPDIVQMRAQVDF